MYQRIFGDQRGQQQQEEEEGDGEVHQDYAETYHGQDTTKEYIANISFEQVTEHSITYGNRRKGRYVKHTTL